MRSTETGQHAQLQTETQSPFSLDFLQASHEPIDLGQFHVKALPYLRVNHYLVKSNDSDSYQYGEAQYEDIRRFIKLIEENAKKLGVSVDDRYCYLTIDQGFVQPHNTLRAPGWHIDGLQGQEVPIKKPGDLTFFWTDNLPTRFANQSFDVDGLDLSVHNIFKHLENQIDPQKIFESKPNHLYALSAYHVHAAQSAAQESYRRFIRVSYTMTPVTSVKMTVNPTMTYNYPYHVTTGEIPKHLK